MRIYIKHYRVPKSLVGELVNRFGEEYVGRHGPAFRYENPEKTHWKPWPYGGYTMCTLVMSDGREFVGVAECSPRDLFDFSAGRRLALRRALQAAFGVPDKVFAWLGVAEVV